jgi:hypothetical protein
MAAAFSNKFRSSIFSLDQVHHVSFFLYCLLTCIFLYVLLLDVFLNVSCTVFCNWPYGCFTSRLIINDWILVNRDSSVSIVTRTWAGNWGILDQFQAEARDLHLLRNVQTAVGTHPVSCSLSTGVSFSRSSCPGMNLFTHLYLALRLRISADIPGLSFRDLSS